GTRVAPPASARGHDNRLYVMNLDDQKPRPIAAEGVQLASGTVSPDGKSVAAISADRLATIYPASGGAPLPIPGVSREQVPLRWSEDGRSIYMVNWQVTPSRIDLVDVATGRQTFVRDFRPVDPAGANRVGPVEVTPDGKAYVYSYRRVLDDLFVAKGFQ